MCRDIDRHLENHRHLHHHWGKRTWIWSKTNYVNFLTWVWNIHSCGWNVSLLLCPPLKGRPPLWCVPRWQKSNVSPNRSLGKLRRRETGQEKQPNFTFPLFLCQSEDKFGQGLGPCYRNLQRQKISFAMILIFDVSCHSKGQKYIWSKSITGPAQCILQ